MTALKNPTPATRKLRAASTASRTAQKKQAQPDAATYRLARSKAQGNSTGEIPQYVTLIRPVPGDPTQDQLFLDFTPLPRDAWKYDPIDRVLSWQGAFGGGCLMLVHAGVDGGVGNIGGPLDPIGVTVTVCANFLCDIALNTGATCITNGGNITGFNWDPASAAWQSAKWIKDRLLLTYTVTPGSNMQPPTFTFTFTDNETGAIPWSPVNFTPDLTLATNGGKMVWDLSFLHNPGTPAPEQGGTTPAAGEPDTVYPYFMKAIEDAAAETITGVMMIDGTSASDGVLVGINGVRPSAIATGYFQVSSNKAPFGIFLAKMIVDGKPVPGVVVNGNTLRWSDLPPAMQQRTGLGANGHLTFLPDGSAAVDGVRNVVLRRLSTSALMSAMAAHANVHPAVAEKATLFAKQQSSPLSIISLLAMSPYQQNSAGQWFDAVQKAVTGDLQTIMNSFIPSDMWSLIFPTTQQPTLTGELATVANSPVPNVADPAAWYQSLATAVMTSGMANGSDENCRNMNGPRASAWLKTQVATSKVYQAHSQLLFQYEWAQQFPLITQFLSDQIANAALYKSQIQAKVSSTVADIHANVQPDPTDPDMITKLIAQVENAGSYATTNNLYWAFAYYTYNTTPQILTNIVAQMSFQTGSQDASVLTRLFQQNVAVLTALDPSGYFARHYTKTINIFMATNVLPSMFGFGTDSETVSLLRQYLQYFVANNLSSEDKQIAQAAAQIQEFLADQQSEKMLTDSVEMLRALSSVTQDALGLPIVANKFVKMFSQKFPAWADRANVIGSLMIGGIAAMGIVTLIGNFKKWSTLTPAERAQLVTDAAQFGLQIVAAVAKRGVRIYDIFTTDGLTATQRMASVSKIMATGDDAISDGLASIGSRASRWLASVDEGVSPFGQSEMIGMVLLTTSETSAEETSMLVRILGKNLDEFVATRVGPVFILAGIGFSIYDLAEGEGKLEEVADYLNIVSGSLMLIAIAGSFAVEGSIFAGIASVAGPLAIIAALAGLAIMIYEMSQTPPDPVKTFVDQYVRKAGFYVGGTSSSIDYATSYINPDQSNLLMIGSTFASSGSTLLANNDGSISLGAATPLPNSVWLVQTNALGMSQIFTIVQPSGGSPTCVFLSLMSDNSVSFQPQMPATPPPSGATIQTQTWFSAPVGNATLTSSGNFLASLNLTLQAVLADANGNFNQVAGYLVQTAQGISYASSPGTVFTLTMSGMAPNYMAMHDLSFVLNSTPSTYEVFTPQYAVPPSTPLTCSLTPALPPFLTFNSNGSITPNGQEASAALSGQMSIAAANSLGKDSVSFTLTVS